MKMRVHLADNLKKEHDDCDADDHKGDNDDGDGHIRG